MNKKPASNASYDDIMTVHELADFLRLSEATIYRLAQTKRIPAIKIGRAWRFQKKMVEEWMKREIVAANVTGSITIAQSDK